jgi:hypothetical protein
MKSRDFVYWLQGYFELEDKGKGLSSRQVNMIKRHIALVFIHEIDPKFKGNKKQLQKIHDGGTSKHTSEPVYRC